MQDYKLQEEIGRSKFSVVQKGRKKKSFEFLAIKSIEKSQREKILNEVKIFHKLDHPNILKFHTWQETRNHIWVIEEQCPGGDLLTLLVEDRILPEITLRRFSIDVVHSIIQLHRNSIIFRDLKPANVILSENGTLKLADFGYSVKVAHVTGGDELVSFMKNKKGTPNYMAPELFTEYGVQSYKSDMQSLGCLIQEMAVGHTPHAHTNLQKLIQSALHDEIEQPSQLNENLVALLKKLLEKDPEKRISQKELGSHPFWQGKLTVALDFVLPDIPAQNDYLKKRGTAPKVDVMRLSQNVKRNQLVEANAYTAANGDEVKVDRNTVVDFEEKNQERAALDSQADEPYESKETNLPEHREQAEDSEAQLMFASESSTAQLHVKPKVRPDARPVEFINFTTTIQNKNIQIENLVITVHDTSVKPIIGNKEIEPQVEPTYNAKQLNFDPYKPEEILQVSENAFQNHMLNIYRKIKSRNIGLNEKLQLFNQFETLIVDSSLANRLVNSEFLNTITQMLNEQRNSMPVNLKLRLCSILGQLVRHSTQIDAEVVNKGLSSCLIEIVKKETTVKVKKVAISALGEYLFQIATQIDDTDDESSKEWVFPESTQELFVKIFKTTGDEEEMVKFQMLKTMENITAHSVKIGQTFATEEQAKLTFNLVAKCKNDAMRNTGIVVLGHMCRINFDLIPFLQEHVKIKTLVQWLTFANARGVQALLNIFNLGFMSQEYNYKLKHYFDTLTDKSQLASSVIGLFDHQSIQIRGKAMLAAAFLLRYDCNQAMFAVEHKLHTYVDRMNMLDPNISSKQKQVQNCLQQLLESVEMGLINLIQNVQLGGDGSPPAGLEALICVNTLLGSQTFKNKIINAYFIQHMSNLFEASTALEDSSEQKAQLFSILENVASNPQIIVVLINPICENLLPIFKVFIRGTNTQYLDHKLMSLKVLNDVIFALMNDNSTLSQDKVNDFLKELLVSEQEGLLKDVDPIPTLALKMASNILVFNSKLYKECDLKALKFAETLSKAINEQAYERISNPLLSLMTKILILDVDNVEISVLEAECGFMQKVKTVMSHFQENVEILENQADIVEVLLKKAHGATLPPEMKAKVIDFGYQFFEQVISLLEDKYEGFAEKSLNIMLQIAQNANGDNVGAEKVQLGSQHQSNVKWCLMSENFTVVKRIAKLLIWSFKNEGLVGLHQALNMDSDIKTNLEKYQYHENQSTSQNVKELMRLLQNNNV